MKKKKNGRLGSLLMMLVGALSGIFAVDFMAERYDSFFVSIAILSSSMLLGMYLQIIIHDSGHLLFGLLTGYRFCSFRIGSLMWIRQDGALRFRRFKLAGTGGQCLLSPPDWREDFPFIWYNLGGVLCNLISAVLFFCLSFVCPPLPRFFLRFSAFLGLAFALINGLPMRVGPVDNDGKNILSIRKSPAARRAFWLQLRVNAAQAEGLRLRDMPEDCFSVPGDETSESSIVAAVAVLRAQRLMDEHRFDESAALMEQLCSQSALPYQSILKIELAFLALLGVGEESVIDALDSREMQNYMKAMRNNPSVIRTQYALALLRDHDTAAANKYRAAFDRVAARYPYPAEIENERELLALVDQKEKSLA